MKLWHFNTSVHAYTIVSYIEYRKKKKIKYETLAL